MRSLDGPARHMIVRPQRQPWNRLPPLAPRRRPTLTERVTARLDVIMPKLWPYFPLIVLVAAVLGFVAGLKLHGLTAQ